MLMLLPLSSLVTDGRGWPAATESETELRKERGGRLDHRQTPPTRPIRTLDVFRPFRRTHLLTKEARPCRASEGPDGSSSLWGLACENTRRRSEVFWFAYASSSYRPVGEFLESSIARDRIGSDSNRAI